MTGLDDTLEFQPRFDDRGLIAAIVTDDRDGTVLMFAYMNAEALGLTRATGLAHFWSRSRGKIWKKGETSGETMRVTHMLVDCDQDALVLKVVPQGKGAACHTGRRSCFYRRLTGDRLEWADVERVFEPATVYGHD